MRRVIDGDFADQSASIIETQNAPSYIDYIRHSKI